MGTALTMTIKPFVNISFYKSLYHKEVSYMDFGHLTFEQNLSSGKINIHFYEKVRPYKIEVNADFQVKYEQ